MDRRSFLLTSLTPLALTAAERPNIVVVLMDDFGIGHFAPLSQNLKVPQFDPALVAFVKQQKDSYTPEQALEFSQKAMPGMLDLAKTGVVFTNAFSACNLCAPARTAILTGQFPARMGLYQNSDVEFTGFTAGTVLAKRLQDAGYATGFIGKYHTGPRDESLKPGPLADTGYIGSAQASHHPLNNGFDYWFGYNHWQSPFYNATNVWENREWAGVQKPYNTETFTEKAIAFIQQARQNKKPFYLQMCVHAVHGPLKPKAPARHFDRFPSTNYELTDFYAHVSAVDEAVTRLRTAIGESAWKNTLFVFASDNGAPVDIPTPLPGNAPHSGHKGMFLLGGIRVPLLLHWPAAFRGGKTSKAMVSTLDIMPTALDAAGLPPAKGIDGRSLLPAATGRSEKVHDHLVWAGIHARTWGFHRGEVMGTDRPESRREESPGAWVVSDGRYLLRYITETPAGLFSDVPNGLAAHFEMFDLREDPLEKHNIHEQVPQVAAKLKAAFQTESANWPPPTKWRKDRWTALMAPVAPKP